MAWADYLNALMIKLSAAAGGDGGAGHVTVQRELPVLRASDPVAILTQFSPALVHAVSVQNFAGVALVGAPAPDGNRVPSSTLVDGTDGSFTGDLTDIIAVNKGDDSITAAEYVAGYGDTSGSAWRRCKGAPPTAEQTDDMWIDPPSYEPCSALVTDVSGGQGSIAFVRQAITDWQACVNYAAQILQNVGGDATKKLDGGTVEAFYQLLGKLADDLDVLAENPPATPDIGEALSYAKAKTEAAVVDIAKKGGQAAAELGNLAGQVAGSFGSGFFSQATFLTLAVAGVAVYVLIA